MFFFLIENKKKNINVFAVIKQDRQTVSSLTKNVSYLQQAGEYVVSIISMFKAVFV